MELGCGLVSLHLHVLMKKQRFVIIMLLLLSGFPVFSKGMSAFDLGVTLGSRNHFFETGYDDSQLSFQYGMTMGFSPFYELDVVASSELFPDFFDSVPQVQVLVQRSLLGFRNSGTKVAGMGFNMMMGFGIGFSDFNPEGRYTLTHLLVSLTPLMGGSPSLGKRERILGCTFAVNMYTQQVSLYFDLMVDDFYIVGTYKDHLDEI